MTGGKGPQAGRSEVTSVTTRREESQAIRAALAPDSLAGFAGQCHVASVRLVEAAETKGTALSRLWRRARVARGTHANVPIGHSWVVVDERRIVDVTLWYYDRAVEPVHRTSVDDPAYGEGKPVDRYTPSELNALSTDEYRALIRETLRVPS